MSLYDVAYVTWPVLIALLVAIPITLLLGNRRAWKDGYHQGREDEKTAFADDLKRRWQDAYHSTTSIRPAINVSRVDPPNASY